MVVLGPGCLVQPTNQPRLGQPWLVGPTMVHLAPIDLGLVITYILKLVGPLDQCTKFFGLCMMAWRLLGALMWSYGKYPMKGGRKWTTKQELGVHGAMWMTCD